MFSQTVARCLVFSYRTRGFFEKHPNQPYCMAQIPPKLEKMEQKHADKLDAA
jgi:hypothetical protein